MSSQLLRARSILPHGKDFHLFASFCRLLQSAGISWSLIFFLEGKVPSLDYLSILF